MKDIADPKEKKMIEWVSTIYSTMRQEKEIIMPLLADITALFRPERQNLDFRKDADLGASASIYDGEPIVAMDMMASGLFSWTMPPYSDWLKYSPIIIGNEALKKSRDLQSLARQYADECSEYMAFVTARSNFYPSMATIYKDGVCYGTASPYVEEDEENGGPCVTPLHIREIYVMENQYGRVDVMFRLLEFTPTQYVQKFRDSLTEKEIKEATSNPSKMRYVLHTMYPRSMLDFWEFPGEGTPAFELAENKKFASDYYILPSASSPSVSRLIKTSGTPRFNAPVWRTIRSTNFPYGSSPTIAAIYDTKMLQVMSKSMADAGQLAAKPPLIVDDGLYEELDIRSGGVTRRSNPNDKVDQVTMSHQFPWGIEMLERRAKIIYNIFQTGFFQSVSSIQNSSRERTRAEIYELKGEAAAALSTLIVNSEHELIRPVMKLIQENEIEHGRWPMPPEALMEADVDFDLLLTGTLFQAQKRYIATQRIVSPLVNATQFANADANVLLKYDFVGASEEIARNGGLAERFIVGDKEFSERAKARAEAEAQMRQLQMQSIMNRDLPAQAKAPEPGSVLEKKMKEAE